MKTSIEISGYLITIEEVDGLISVNAAKDNEVLEEFTINVEESDDEFAKEDSEEMNDVKPFGEYDEEEDFEDQEDEIQNQIDENPESEMPSDENEDEEDDDEDDDDEDEENDNDDELSLESFQSFINKKPASKRK